MENSVAGDTEGTRVKRKRKPSEKLLESQAEKIKKPPSKPVKSSGKSSSKASKSTPEPESSNGLNGDYASDD